MWPNSCVITTKCAAYYTCSSPTTCKPMFSPCFPAPPRWWQKPYDAKCLMGAGGGREGTSIWWILGHWVRKATNHTSEILIRALGRTEAVTIAVLLGFLSTLKAKLHSLSHTHTRTIHTSQKSLPLNWNRYCNYPEGMEDSTAESACLSSCKSNAFTLCVCMCVRSHACMPPKWGMGLH